MTGFYKECEIGLKERHYVVKIPNKVPEPRIANKLNGAFVGHFFRNK